MDKLVDQLSDILLDKSIKLVTAESCTGGLISAFITERPGSSAIFDRGFVTYSNQAKMDFLSVSVSLLEQYGAVSGECARAMAQGALDHSAASIAVSVTGIAGPDGGSEEKPVGLVYIGVVYKEGTPLSYKHIFTGNRSQVRMQACEKALEHLIATLQEG